MKNLIYFKDISCFMLVIAGFFFATVFSSCSSNSKTSSPSSRSSSSSIAIHSSNLVGQSNTYSGTTGSFDVAFSYNCANGVSGNATLSDATLSLGSAKSSSCVFTFNSVTYNGSTLSCDTSTSVSASTPASAIPLLINCSPYALKITTSGIFNTSTSPSLYLSMALSFLNTSTASSSNVVKPVVGAGDAYTCALARLSGTTTSQIYCWGDNSGILPATYIAPTQISTTFTPQTLSVGDELVCTMDASNNVWCMGTWGTSANTSFTQINGITNAQQVSTGFESACALTTASNTTLYCWGYVDFASPAASGAYYSGATSSPSDLVTISGFSGSISQFVISNDWQFAAYGALCAVVGSDSHVECAGNKLYGQLGIGGTDDSNYHTPAPVMINSTTELKDVVQLSGRSGTFCATTTSSSVYCWGAVNDTPYPEFLAENYTSPMTPFMTADYPFLLNSNTITGIIVREPNFLGALSFGSTSGGGYLYANSPTDSTRYDTNSVSYITNLSYATLIPSLNLKTLSVGAQAICGSFEQKIYCHGADLTYGGVLYTYPYTGYVGFYGMEDTTQPMWFGISPQVVTLVAQGGDGLWLRYAFGDSGTALPSFPAGPPYVNQVISYSFDASTTGGGVFNLSQDITDVSVGSGLRQGCYDLYYGTADAGHACVVTYDGAISCFGSNNCGQVGDNTARGAWSDPPHMNTSPTAVLYPSGSGYSGGVSY